MARHFPNWVEAFENHTEDTGSPARLRRWAAIACIAGALERRTWVHTAKSNLYPNLYTLLISPPGVGKSKVLNLVYEQWQKLLDHRTAPSSVSKASLIDELSDAHRAIIRLGHTPATVEFNSLKVLSTEFGVFLPEFANEFMSVLTDIYDGYPYAERRRTKNLQISIPKPQLNILSGTTPDYLSRVIPEGAWDQGFMSRTILIYGADRRMVSLFTASTADAVGDKMLQDDLDKIGELYGEIKFTPEAAAFVDQWYLGGQNPVPAHPKLQNYNTRRPAHLLKLCQVACAATQSKLLIDVPQIQLAMDWLFDAETAMPDIFKSMAAGGDSRVMDEAWHFLFMYKAKFKKGAPEALLVRFLTTKVPSHNVDRILQLLERSNMIRAEAVKGEGMLYTPKDKGDLG